MLTMLYLGLVIAAAYRWGAVALRRREHDRERLLDARTADLRRREKELEYRNAQLRTRAELLDEAIRVRSRLFARPGRDTLAQPVTRPDPPPTLDQRLRPLVEARLADPNFGPDALAAAAELSYHQLYRALRKELGMTPSRFIRNVRVECAAILLRQTTGSVTEIAYSVGFESLSYFRRAFHERFHTSPTGYLAATRA